MNITETLKIGDIVTVLEPMGRMVTGAVQAMIGAGAYQDLTRKQRLIEIETFHPGDKEFPSPEEQIMLLKIAGMIQKHGRR